ncbi:uncharacterized protein LOC128240468 [Mya arenaria]|uniref:uncharacterized protein LOC128240468 n=1 Tax=Mya arenaria TaxID=6604 RepID=UPI0022DEA48E|nr:uncharacterized protein LOC128240468 [Mya arenaria]
MLVTFSSIFCCCLSLSVISHAFILDSFPDCSLAEIRQHCNDRAVQCKRLNQLSGRRYYCTCEPGFHGNSCDQGSSRTSTLAPTAATQAVQTTTTKTDPQVNQFCNKYSVVVDLSHGQPVSNGFAPKCPSGSFASTEAFVLNNCNVSP